jgi:hypothetical protein
LSRRSVVVLAAGLALSGCGSATRLDPRGAARLAVATQRAIWSRDGRAVCAAMSRAMRVAVVRAVERRGGEGRCAFDVSHYQAGSAPRWVLPDDPAHVRAVRTRLHGRTATVTLGGMEGLASLPAYRLTWTGTHWLITGGSVVTQFR